MDAAKLSTVVVIPEAAQRLSGTLVLLFKPRPESAAHPGEGERWQAVARLSPADCPGGA